MNKPLGVWFPTVRTNTGTDVFTERLVEGLNKKGIRAEITWLPLRAEYAPWTVSIPQPPKWATIAHVNTWLHSRFLPKNIPIIATLHHSIHDPKLRPYKGWLRAIYHRFWIAPNERRIMYQAAQVTAVSQYVAEISKKTLCDIPIQVIYNGVDTELFCPSNQVRQVNVNEPFRLLFIGNWIARKGVDLIAPIMRELGNDFELHYTGGKAAAKDKMSMPNNMYDLGRLNQQEVIIAMQNADALLFPSRSEGFGLVAVEAIACGLPVIAMKGTCLDEIITHENEGYLCDAEKILSFVNAIKNLQLRKLTLDSNYINLKNNIFFKFSFDYMLNQYSLLYEAIALMTTDKIGK